VTSTSLFLSPRPGLSLEKIENIWQSERREDEHGVKRDPAQELRRVSHAFVQPLARVMLAGSVRVQGGINGVTSIRVGDDNGRHVGTGRDDNDGVGKVERGCSRFR